MKLSFCLLLVGAFLLVEHIEARSPPFHVKRATSAGAIVPAQTLAHVTCIPQATAGNAKPTCSLNSFRVVNDKVVDAFAGLGARRWNESRLTASSHLDMIAELDKRAQLDALRFANLDQGSPAAGAAAPLVVASISFEDTVDKNGWSTVVVTSQSTVDDASQLYASGFLEGFITGTRITQSIEAQYQAMFTGGTSVTYGDLNKFVIKQREWFTKKTSEHPTDPFWQAVHLAHTHIVGMQAGYEAYSKSVTGQPAPYDLVFWNQRADLGDVQAGMDGPTSCWLQPPDALANYERKRTHCSALLTPFVDADGYQDFAVTHNTWDDFRSLLRTWKTYSFKLDLPFSAAAQKFREGLSSSPATPAAATPAGAATAAADAAPASTSTSHAAATETKLPWVQMMSSYPGITQSIDDFYMLAHPSQQLLITETTNSICDSNLYAKIVPESLFTWHRVIVANMLAFTGDQWTAALVKENSGTYNNQFMVVAANAFPTRTLCVDSSSSAPCRMATASPSNSNIETAAVGAVYPKEFAWIVEQYPGGYKRDSISEVINSRGYWPSYNRPYFPEVFEVMGFGWAALAHGDYYTYNKTARALIFDREAPLVIAAKTKSLSQLKKLMRYNDFEKDPLSKGDASWAIASRYDLLPTKKEQWALDGAIDAKIGTVGGLGAAAERLKEIFGVPRAGGMLGRTRRRKTNPVTAHIISGPTAEQQPAFGWGPYWNYTHSGIPEVLNFDWVTVEF